MADQPPQNSNPPAPEPNAPASIAPQPPQQIAHATGGQIIQAHGNVIITPPAVVKEPAPPPKKSLVERWQTWVALLGLIVTITTTVLTWPKLWRENVAAESARYYGVVLDENNHSLAQAAIEISETNAASQLLGKGETLPNGEFEVLVKAQPGATVWVKISKLGYRDFTGMKSLSGNDRVILSKSEDEP